MALGQKSQNRLLKRPLGSSKAKLALHLPLWKGIEELKCPSTVLGAYVASTFLGRFLLYVVWYIKIYTPVVLTILSQGP